MPIYEYLCESCEHKLEALQKISDQPLSECPECAKPTLKKLISAAAFRLKGGGWYETDFKTGNRKNLAGDSGGESKTTSPKDSAAKAGSANS
jgi:putative FmdB family regulatory protein